MFFLPQKNNNNHENTYGAVITAKPLQEFSQFTRQVQNSADGPPTLGPTQQS